MVININTIEQIHDIRNTILCNLKKTYSAIKELLNGEDELSTFALIRFQDTSFDPIKGTPLNFIEMLNQTFSDLIVLYGAEELIKKHPGHTFTVRLGAQSGYDIESDDGSIVGECFAVTKISSNKKLKKDVQKLMSLGENVQKYIVFYSETDTNEKICNYIMNNCGITYIRVNKFAKWSLEETNGIYVFYHSSNNI